MRVYKNVVGGLYFAESAVSRLKRDCIIPHWDQMNPIPPFVLSRPVDLEV